MTDAEARGALDTLELAAGIITRRGYPEIAAGLVRVAAIIKTDLRDGDVERVERRHAAADAGRLEAERLEERLRANRGKLSR